MRICKGAKCNTPKVQYSLSLRRLKCLQLKAAMEVMEKGLEIQGVTAIEDKLQDGVPDALNCLRTAGTKVRQNWNSDTR